MPAKKVTDKKKPAKKASDKKVSSKKTPAKKKPAKKRKYVKKQWTSAKKIDVGRKPIFSDPQEIWNCACDYFQRIEDNPRNIDVHAFNGIKFVTDKVPKRRPFLLGDLLDEMNISKPTWAKYREKEQFVYLIERIEGIIYRDKFIGAVLGEFNANIISRDLGLADKKDITTTNPDLTPWSDIEAGIDE